MKTAITLKEFGALSFSAVLVRPATAPAMPQPSPQRMSDSVRRFAVKQAKRAEKFREMLRQRETTPFVSAIPYHRFGIND